MTSFTADIKETIRSLEGPIVVFGAGGFFGANLLRALLVERSDVYGVTHQTFIPWRLIGLPTANILQCDITQQAQTQRLFDEFGFRSIFCLAAYGGYARQNDAQKIFQTNLIGLMNILSGAEVKGFSALVHAGSSSEYGENSAAPSETAELRPNSYYSVSKTSAAHLLSFLARTKSLPVINLRYYSLYGPWEESDRLVPTLLTHAQNGDLPPLVDPEISRDFVYVEDAVNATLLAATEGIRQRPGGSLNISTGKKTTIREIVREVKELYRISKEPQWATMQNRKWDLRDWYGNPELAKKILGWQATTTLREGLLRTRQWFDRKIDQPDIAKLVPIKRAPRISAIIACYKDGQAIPIMYDRLKTVFQKLKVDYEIIFVNDASPDQSDLVLTELTNRDHHVIAIEHSRNFGSQSAFVSGMRVSTGDAIILLDGDLQDPPELIARFYEQWAAGYEVIYGRRVHRETSRWNNFCYRTFYRLLGHLSYVPIPVDAGDFSLMDRKVVNEILSLPEADQFLRGLRAWVGFKQIGVDYIRPERMFGRSTNNLRKNFWWARKALFSFSFAPLEFMLYFGMALTFVSFLLMLVQIVAKLMRPDVPHGLTTIIVLILFFGGVQMLTISILGEYLGKVLEETKRRPKFIRKAIRFGGNHLTTAAAINEFVDARSRVAEFN
jgi:nucleoside-diphosphate-sugar epimerase/glycosyltransferase involved in cell wall biosynthesis